MSAFENWIPLYLPTPLDIMICNKLGAVFQAAAGAFFSARNVFLRFWEHAISGNHTDCVVFTVFCMSTKKKTNMASPAQMTITTRTASKFCTKRRALQLPIFFLKPISLVISRIIELWRYQLDLSVRALGGGNKRTCMHPRAWGGGFDLSVTVHREGLLL